MPSSYFLIVSPMRSGSTWLTMMLNEFEGVSADREMKWDPEERLFKEKNPIHIYLAGRQGEVKQALAEKVGRKGVIGSKLTLDIVDYPPESLARLASCLSRDVKVIFLRRHPTDIILSLRRGVGIKLAESYSDSTMANVLEGIQDIYEDRDYDSDFFEFSPCEFLSQFELFERQQNWCESLQGQVDHFLEVEYDDVVAQFDAIVEFLGVDTTQANIRHVLENPPTEKTGPSRAEQRRYAKKHTNLGWLAYWSDGRGRWGQLKIRLASWWFGCGQTE